ncbi:MAG: radical SAM protein, partial [Lachnospiraceae bacterium]
ARAALHMWEEPVISGISGSGTVFFSGCALGCVFCQNRTIAKGQTARVISSETLTEKLLMLQEMGAHNINLVTGSHYVPQIVKALRRAKERGLSIPVVYNTGSYEKVQTLRLLEGLVDIWLPDLKYMDSRLAARYAGAPDYFKYASAAIGEMLRQTEKTVLEPVPGVYTEDGEELMLMKKGVIVRHLLLPGQLEDSKNIIRYLYETWGNQIYISIMNQYTPCNELPDYPELQRKVTQEEYDALVDYAIELGVEQGFIQEGETAEESFIPAFDYEGLE